MRQRIENNQEQELTEASVTAMFDGSHFTLGRFISPCAREITAPSLSAKLAVKLDRASIVPSLPGWLKASPKRRRAHSPSLSHTEKFPVEASMYPPLWLFWRPNPNMRSPKAVAIATTALTEQRRCAAA